MGQYYIARTEDSNYFEHHGILGQKWGKKNGPPYPLDAKDHSASEKKAGNSGWTNDAKKSMSNEELRKAVNRKNLENQYHRLASSTGTTGKANDAIDVANKTLRTTGKVARAVATGNRYKADGKNEAIEDDDTLTKKQKKQAKKEIKENRNAAKADVVGNVSNQLANSTAKISDKTDLSKMTDKDLKDAVERLNLEAQYDSLYGSKSGKDYVFQVLDTVGDIAEITGTALTIALAIKALKTKS